MPREIAIVIPTIREESFKTWLEAWSPLIDRHDAALIVVRDGDNQRASILNDAHPIPITARDVLGDDSDLIIDFSPACCALGFAIIHRMLPDVRYIIKLDDDLSPIGDPIQDHVDALNMRVPSKWLPTASMYMRGFPYAIREENPVHLSHGVWQGIPDLDAISQLAFGPRHTVQYYRGPIPRNVFTPISGMNVAFTREMLPLMYWCPAKLLPGAGRFDDIWTFLYVLRDMWRLGWSAVSGYATVEHERASNVYANLIDEAVGIRVNELLWKYLLHEDSSVLPQQARDFIEIFESGRDRWKAIMSDPATQFPQQQPA